MRHAQLLPGGGHLLVRLRQRPRDLADVGGGEPPPDPRGSRRLAGLRRDDRGRLRVVDPADVVEDPPPFLLAILALELLQQGEVVQLVAGGDVDAEAAAGVDVDGERILDRPRSERRPDLLQIAHLERLLRRVGQHLRAVPVHAVAISLEGGADLGLELGDHPAQLILRVAARAGEDVSRQELLAENLGQRAARGAARQLHLPEAVLGVGVAERLVEAFVVRGRDGRHAVGIAGDRRGGGIGGGGAVEPLAEPRLLGLVGGALGRSGGARLRGKAARRLRRCDRFGRRDRRGRLGRGLRLSRKKGLDGWGGQGPQLGGVADGGERGEKGDRDNAGILGKRS